MQIIFGKDVADQVREKHITLELETFTFADGRLMTAYCVLESEKIVMEMPDIERLCGLHQALIDAWNRQDYGTVQHGMEHLRGRFGGQMDSFYDEIDERLKGMGIGN